MNRLITILSIVAVLLLPSIGAYAASYEVTRWFDSFESHACGDYVMNLLNPEIPINSSSLYWDITGKDFFYSTIDCSKASGGTHSLKQAWNGSNYDEKGSNIKAYPDYYVNAPKILVRPGCTTVAEMDVYFVYDGNAPYYNIGQGHADLAWHSNGAAIAGWYASGEWTPIKYLKDELAPSGLYYWDAAGTQVKGNRWYHIRTEVYDNFTYSIIMTEQGESPITVIANAPCAHAPESGFYSVGNVDYLQLELAMTKGTIHWDNVKVFYINNASQGFHGIYTVPAGIAVDGTIGASEWTKATKVASKPLGSNGVFAPTSTHANVVMDVNQYIDVYTAYDSSNYYVAAKFNTTVINAGTYAGSYIEAIFADEPNSLVYVFGCCAKATSGTSGQLRKFVGKHNMTEETSYDPCQPGLNYADFTAAGGLIAYSVSGDVMSVEMKIPFTRLAGFAPFAAGKKVNLQFNVTGAAYGSKLDPPDYLIACTTNIGFERYPWQASNNDIGTPFGAGVAYAACGDADNPYPVGDLNTDCVVNFEDLAILVSHWLACNAVSCD